MAQDLEIIQRYTRASTDLDGMIANAAQVPLSQDEEQIVKEYVEAATAYADDLENNGHAVPVGLRDKIARTGELLR
jgi:hypothetical protein